MEQKTEASLAVDEPMRADFEAWHRSKFATRHSTGQPTRDMHNGIYAEEYGPEHQQKMWEAWQASRAALKAQPAPTEAPTKPTMMPNDEALTWAWKSLRKDLGDERWTTGDSCTYFGFFCWGWRYRTQYEKQKTTEAAQVTVEQGGVYITKGVQSFRLAYEGETQAEKEWYAGQLRAALGQGEDSARLDAERYRWLLENYAFGDGYNHIDAALNDGEADKYLSAAIDRARASTETGGVKP